MKKIYYIIATLIVSIACITTACNDAIDPITTAQPDGMLAFYNASQLFTNVTILLNTDDLNYKPDSVTGPEAVYMPQFQNESGQLMSPGGGGALSAYPWARYIRVFSGMQKVSFITANKQLAVKTGVDIEANQRYTIYLTDSLGSYQTTTISDNCELQKGNVQLNIVHLSPDAGKLAFRIDGKWLTENKLLYRNNTGFIPFEAKSSNNLLNILVANATDTTDLFASNVISADADHCYTVLVKGYAKSHTSLLIKPQFQISIVKNK